MVRLSNQERRRGGPSRASGRTGCERGTVRGEALEPRTPPRSPVPSPPTPKHPQSPTIPPCPPTAHPRPQSSSPRPSSSLAGAPRARLPPLPGHGGRSPRKKLQGGRVGPPNAATVAPPSHVAWRLFLAPFARPLFPIYRLFRGCFARHSFRAWAERNQPALAQQPPTCAPLSDARTTTRFQPAPHPVAELPRINLKPVSTPRPATAGTDPPEKNARRRNESTRTGGRPALDPLRRKPIMAPSQPRWTCHVLDR